MKSSLTIIDTDVLVIGSGIAGLQAALTVAANGKKPLLVSKSPIGKANNTVLAGGGFAHAGSQFSEEDHLRKTLSSGRMLNDRALVKCFVKRAPEKIRALRQRGLSGHFQKTGFYFRTGLKGLFAAGEVVGGIHGANRMGGNALSEGLVFGPGTDRNPRISFSGGLPLRGSELAQDHLCRPCRR